MEKEVGRTPVSHSLLAIGENPRRRVLLKIMREGGGPGLSTEGLNLIANEAQISASLDHPNIVRLFESGVIGPYLYIAMAPVQGLSVEAVLRKKGNLQVRTGAEIALEVAKALAFGHGRGIFHRNLKSTNVFLRPGGKVCVADFGLQRIPDPLDKAGRGTDYSHMPEFLAPEQAAGDFDRVDQRSDVYALGVLLYKMLTSRSPFENERDTLTHYQILNAKPVPPRHRTRSVPRSLESICLKAIRKKPHERYWSMAEMATDLNRYLSGEPVRAEEEARKSRLLYKLASSKVWMAAAFILALALAVTAGVIFRSASPSQGGGGEIKGDEKESSAKGSGKNTIQKRKAKNSMREALSIPMTRDKLEERITKLEEATCLDPDLWEAHLHLGYALLLSGKDQTAVDSMSRGSRSHDTPYSKYLWGIVYHEYHMNPEASLKEFSRGAELTPSGHYGLLCRAWSLWLEKKDRDVTLEALVDADEANSYPWETGLLRGIIYHTPPGAKLSKARLSFSRSTEALGGYSPALVRRALAYLDENMVALAWKDLDEAIDIDPSQAHARSIRGLLFLQEKKYKEAHTDLTMAVATAPRFRLARVYKGDVLVKLELFDEAIKEFTKAIDLRPQDPSAFPRRGYALHRKDRLLQAETDFRKAVELAPFAAEFRFHLGRFLESTERSEEALNSYNHAVRLCPKGAIYYEARGNLNYNLERFIKAREDYEQAIINDSTLALPYLRAATIMAFYDPNPEMAIDYLEEGIRNCPHSPHCKEMEDLLRKLRGK